MAQQSSGEFASANPTKGEEDARVQERGIRAKISLNPRSHLQHIQRPTPISPQQEHNQAFRASAVQTWREVVADEPASKFQQRDNALEREEFAQAPFGVSSPSETLLETTSMGQRLLVGIKRQRHR
jgi:hypothetical protein